MKILAVDTSCAVATVAVMENEKLLGEYILNHKKTHSQKIVPMIKEMMDSLELTSADIDIFAASSGPGSFTGLRIGITTVKAMAYAVNKPLISVPTLDALAYNIPISESLICPIMDARNDQVYTAVYKSENGVQIKTTEYMGIPVKELIQLVRGKNQKVIFVGDAVKMYRALLTEELGDKVEFAPGNLLLQRASSVAQIALIKAALGEMENCFDMVPFYLRKSQAEREFDKKSMEKQISQ